MECDFKAGIICHSHFLVTLPGSPAFRKKNKKKTELYQANVGAKVQPHTPYVHLKRLSNTNERLQFFYFFHFYTYERLLAFSFFTIVVLVLFPAIVV